MPGASMTFGIGSSREQAAAVLVHLGVAPVIAPSGAGQFFRNAFIRIVILPGGTARAVAPAVEAHFESLRANGTTMPWRERMLDFDALNALLGTPRKLEQGVAVSMARAADHQRARARRWLWSTRRAASARERVAARVD